jgi:hypothetical protein
MVQIFGEFLNIAKFNTVHHQILLFDISTMRVHTCFRWFGKRKNIFKKFRVNNPGASATLIRPGLGKVGHNRVKAFFKKQK